MKSIRALVTSFAFAALCSGAIAATPEQEKAFLDAYKKAYEAGDLKTLNGFLYTEGATSETIEFFKMMQEPAPGAKITSIELATPSAEETAKYDKATMPDGKVYKMPLKPSKQLVIKIEEKSADGSSTTTTKSPVAEKDGKLVIPVPVPDKAEATAPAKETKAKDGSKK